MQTVSWTGLGGSGPLDASPARAAQLWASLGPGEELFHLARATWVRRGGAIAAPPDCLAALTDHRLLVLGDDDPEVHTIELATVVRCRVLLDGLPARRRVVVLASDPRGAVRLELVVGRGLARELAGRCRVPARAA